MTIYYQRNSKRSSPANSARTADETFVVDSTVSGCEKYSCNIKVKNKCTEIDNESNTPPDIGFSFDMCHPPLSQEADGFQLLVDSRSLKYFIDPESIRSMESRTLEYTRMQPPVEIRAAGGNVLPCTAQGIFTSRSKRYRRRLEDRQISVVLVPGLKKNIFSSLASAQKGFKTII